MSAIQVFERLKSPDRSSGTSTSEKHTYFVTGASDTDSAELAVYNFVDEVVTMPLNGAELPLNEINTKSIGVCPDGSILFESEVTYGTQENSNNKQATFQFKTSGGTQKITNSLQTLGSYTADGSTAPNTNGAINCTKDGVDGCDIIVPLLSWTEKHYLSRTLVTPAYLVTLATLTGKTNAGSFRTFSSGQVLFLGSNGGNDATSLVEITFEFQASIDVSDITIGGISGITKPGWAYLWVMYQDSTDQNFPIKVPKAVYVEQTYNQDDFSKFGIPTGASL